jgi:hypothetical protein
MIKDLRRQFNAWFSQEKFDAYAHEMHTDYNWKVGFRLAETPVFLPPQLVGDILTASETIVDFLVNHDIKALTQPAIEKEFDVPNEDQHTMFLAMDFGICEDENGNIVPKLIELQGFPSLYNYMVQIGETWRRHFPLPENYGYLLTDKGLDYYMARLKRAIMNGHNPKHVVLLEIEPEKQPTSIDFYVAEKEFDIKVLCLSKVILEDRKLYYLENGEKVHIKRIYNRVIFDELKQRPDLERQFNLTEDVDVEWAGHPNWFARISKFLMPYLPASEFIPEARLLSSFEAFPGDLENYVLKPLFSFSGSGVVVDVSPEDIASIPENERHLFMLQRKVNYAPIIKTAVGDGEKAKIEFRSLYLWQEDEPRPEPMIHLLRMSKGKLIGVKYNKDKTWVGSSVAYFDLEQAKNHARSSS